jgi:hypothetical protein
MAEFVALAQRVHYLSTACIHEHHDECKGTCKFCDSNCRCKCHANTEETGQ